MISKEGFDFSFDEKACEKCGGKCCTGESGSIFVSKEELKILRQYLGLDEQEFALKFLKKVGFKMSFKEVKFEDGYACIFFDQVKRNCKIYEYRPSQCRTFPFWKYYKNHKEELEKECIGICYL